jgi:hypothetical protein
MRGDVVGILDGASASAAAYSFVVQHSFGPRARPYLVVLEFLACAAIDLYAIASFLSAAVLGIRRDLATVPTTCSLPPWAQSRDGGQ